MSDYLKMEIFEDHSQDFDEIRKRISEALKDYENFIGVAICLLALLGVVMVIREV